MKKLFGWIVAAVAVIGIASTTSHQKTPTNLNVTPTSSQATPSSTEIQTPADTTPTAVDTTPAATSTPTSTSAGVSDTNLSNGNTYTNVDGNTVHSPASSTDGSVPTGATARCVDGTYSFSQHHSGTCSHHGGVSDWL